MSVNGVSTIFGHACLVIKSDSVMVIYIQGIGGVDRQKL